MRFKLLQLVVFLPLLVLGIGVSAAYAQPTPVVLASDASYTKVEPENLLLSETIPADASIEEVLAGIYRDSFLAATTPVPVLDGWERTIWGHVRLENPGKELLAVNLVAKYTSLDRIDWYQPRAGVEPVRSVSGQLVVLDPEGLRGRFPEVAVRLQPGQTQDVYFRVRSDTVVILPLRVYEASSWQAANVLDVLMFGLLLGCLITMSLFGCIFFMTFRLRAYLWFALFCFAASAHVFLTSGIGKAYLWPGQTVDLLFLMFVFQGLAMGSTALFVASFLNAREQAPRYNRIVQIIAGFSFLTCLATPLPMWIVVLAMIVSTGIGPLLIFGGAIRLWRLGVAGAGLVVLSWIPNQTGIVWAYLRSFNAVSYFDANHYTLPVTCTLTALAFMWALHRRTAEAEYSATHDQLTKLPNRVLFDRAISRPPPPTRRSIGIMQVDLDGFKAVNDTYGHTAGDFVLQTVAERLRLICEENGITFRTGGDEFIVLCNRRTRREDVQQLANQIIESVAQPIAWQDHTLTVGASIGVAFPLEGRETILTAIDEADAALYEAKARGKGQVALSASFDD